MVSKMGANYACLFVGYVEEQTARQYTGFLPQLHKRYIANQMVKETSGNYAKFTAVMAGGIVLKKYLEGQKIVLIMTETFSEGLL